MTGAWAALWRATAATLLTSTMLRTPSRQIEAALLAFPGSDSTCRQDRVTPPKMAARALEFLDYIRQPGATDSSGAFDASKGRFGNVDRVLSYIASDGLTISDVNEPGPRHFPMGALKSALTGRRGDAFITLVHLGYLYAMNLPQYSQLTFAPTSNGVLACLSGGYHLRFQSQHGALQLYELDYLAEENE